MDNLEKLLAEAESQEGDEQWELLEGYDVKDFYSDDQGYVRISGKQIENISENISVSGEDNSQYIEFRMNRFYDGIDLSKMILSIHYEGDGSGDESPIINAYRNSDEIKFGWAIPATATQYNEIEFCVWARGSLEDDSSYVLKTLPKTYKINRGLILGGEIPEPTNNWYLNFVRTMDAKVSVATLCADETQKNAEAVTEMNANVNTKSEQIDSQYTNIETWHQETKTNTEAAKKYYEDTKAISEGISGALKPMGTMAFIELPDLEDVSVGDMYNISDQFVTTEDFREGAGKIIPLGSNIYKTSDGKWDVLAGSPVTGVKGAVEEQYRSGNVDITPENIGLGNVQSDISLNRKTLGYVKKNLWAHGDVSGTLSTAKALVLEPGIYTISALVTSSDTDSNVSLMNIIYEDDTYVYPMLSRDERASKTITLTKRTKRVLVYASSNYNNSVGDTFTFSDIQIEVGSTATDYEPYVDDVNTRLNTVLNTVKSEDALNKQTLGYTKKNLLKLDSKSGSYNGITHSSDVEKGTITFNGTFNGSAFFTYNSKFYLEAGNYILSGCPAGGKDGQKTYYRQALGITYPDGSSTGDWNDYGDGITFTVTQEQVDDGVYFKLVIGIFAEFPQNLTFHPMIRSADITDDTFEPYVDDIDTRLKALTPVNNLLATVPGSPLDAVIGKMLNDMIVALKDSFVVYPVSLINGWNGALFASINKINRQATITGYIDGTNATSVTFAKGRTYVSQLEPTLSYMPIPVQGTAYTAIDFNTELHRITFSAGNDGIWDVKVPSTGKIYQFNASVIVAYD